MAGRALTSEGSFVARLGTHSPGQLQSLAAVWFLASHLPVWLTPRLPRRIKPCAVHSLLLRTLPAVGKVCKIASKQGRLTLRHGQISNPDMPGMPTGFRVTDLKMLGLVEDDNDIRRQRTASSRRSLMKASPAITASFSASCASRIGSSRAFIIVVKRRSMVPPRSCAGNWRFL